ncbi:MULTISPECIES: DUF4998 domain-containing protein [Odoribacteraceae]|uniref:F5/8 type C domain-containing protein n=1 Tax=Butyricimonas virosa TaxID=544645 RepID=A0A412WVG4_9BACT|nr:MULTISPECIES: DUF4998 domain-containing protein [Odoribacteraceae]RGV31301.1 hypothetical protein DWW18_17855 [Butyricimonas virosa]RHM40804.1 hypothetical protein DWZ68_15370 [Butyricimonas virosa]RHR74934.1 hypothetical protein DWW52_18810 [Odoribacter sp. AF15-53]
MKYTYLLGLLAVLFLAGCEDLEDTYEDYVGDGPVRYLAKCTSVEVLSGWNRLIVSWENKLDPNREAILVHCEADGYLYDTVLDANATSCIIRGLADATYSVSVAARDKAGNTSLTNDEVRSGRPYTLSHEGVQGYTRGIVKHIFLGDNLVLFMGTKTDKMLEFVVHYTGTDGKRYDYDVYSEGLNTIFLRGVKASEPVVLTRKGLLEEGPDVIPFPDVTLETNVVNMAGDFSGYLQERYGNVDVNRTNLELDYDLSSIEDILYFKDLKKLELGKNRYYGKTKKMSAISVAANRKRAEECIAFMQEVIGLEVVNYGSHYGAFGIPAETPELPQDLVLMDTEGFTVENSIEGSAPDFESYMLLDNDPTSLWETVLEKGERRIYDLTIDMKEVREVKGLKIVQADVSTSVRNYLPNAITIYVSEDGKTWTNPCSIAECRLGVCVGETKLLNFTSPRNARYIRLTVKDTYYGSGSNMRAGCVLGDVLPF